MAFNADQPLFNPATGTVTGASLLWDQFRGVIGRNSGKWIVLLSDLSFGFEGATQSRGETLTGPHCQFRRPDGFLFGDQPFQWPCGQRQPRTGIVRHRPAPQPRGRFQRAADAQPEQVQALLGQAMKSIRQGGAP